MKERILLYLGLGPDEAYSEAASPSRWVSAVPVFFVVLIFMADSWTQRVVVVGVALIVLVALLVVSRRRSVSSDRPPRS